MHKNTVTLADINSQRRSVSRRTCTEHVRGTHVRRTAFPHVASHTSVHCQLINIRYVITYLCTLRTLIYTLQRNANCIC